MNIEIAKENLDYVLEALLSETSPTNIKSLTDRLAEIDGIYKFENNYIYVIVKNALSKMMIEKFNSNRMNELLQEHIEEKYGFKFITPIDIKNEENQPKPSITNPTANKFDRSDRKLRAEFTFENFVVGESNKFAYLSATTVANNPGSIYNPLYIFGDVGVGKTHLMMSIGHYILDNDINMNVVYTSAQQFVEDFFVYTKKDTKNIEFFYNKYRSADVLLVDDIQFFENKSGTQEEFFKVFDYLHENNKQIVVTSDRPANELKIMTRLKSRFSWGIPVDIKPPSQNLRIDILKRKLNFIISNPDDVPDEVLSLIADTFSSNVRELEGALRRYVTYCVSMNLPFDIDSVYSALDGIMPSKSEGASSKNDKIIKNLIRIVANYFQILEEELLSSSRKPHLVYARNICYYISKTELDISLSKIGEYFNKKDHTTISYGIDKIIDMINKDPKTKTDITYIKDKLFV